MARAARHTRSGAGKLSESHAWLSVLARNGPDFTSGPFLLSLGKSATKLHPDLVRRSGPKSKRPGDFARPVDSSFFRRPVVNTLPRDVLGSSPHNRRTYAPQGHPAGGSAIGAYDWS